MRAGADFHLAFSYERVMVGRLLHNIRRYPRVVGGLTPACTEAAAAVYRLIVEAPVVGTDCLTAEVAKTVENAYRDVNIGFANEVALMCESLGIDVFEVRGLVNNLPNDPSNPGANPVRNMHLPGAGVGGHCLPKDSWLLAHGVERHGRFPVDSKVILGARAVNEAMPRPPGRPGPRGAGGGGGGAGAGEGGGARLRVPGGQRRYAQHPGRAADRRRCARRGWSGSWCTTRACAPRSCPGWNGSWRPPSAAPTAPAS